MTENITATTAMLTVTANSESALHGAPIPVLTGTLTGVVAGEGITANYSTTAVQYSPAGSYPITATLNDPNSKLSNYSVTNTPGTLTILVPVTTTQQSVNFGQVAVGASTGSTRLLSFNIPSGLTLGGISTVTQGAANLDFTVATGGSCTGGATNTSCTVQFNQAGNTNYAAATQVTETVTATRAMQTITFPIPGTKTYGVAPITLTAKASSGLAVSYSVTSGPAAVSGSVLTITGAGSVTVQASQAGNANFAAATAVSVTFTVNKGTSTTIIMSETPNPSITGQAVVVGFTVSGVGIAPTGTVTLSGTGGLTCTGTLTAGAGSCSLAFITTGSKTLTAAYSGDSNYNTSTSAKVTQKVQP